MHDCREHSAELADENNSPERLIIRRIHDIEDATAELLQLEGRAKLTCEQIRERFKFDFAAVQLVDFGEQIIQTVYGSGIGGDWYKVASHTMEGDLKFLDIQADIATSIPPKIEIISGWDPRFDEFIYQKFGHKDFVRIFMPLIVSRDQDGGLIKVDPDRIQIGACPEQPGRKFILHSQPQEDGEFVRPLEVVGTIEAGFDNAERLTSVNQVSTFDVSALFEFACEQAYTLCRATLLHVLEITTRCAREIAGADCANLRFPLDHYRDRHTYNVWAGSRLPASYKTRPDGFGARAVQSGKPMFLPSAGDKRTLQMAYPELYAVGFRAIAAYPLNIDDGHETSLSLRSSTAPRNGILFVGFNDNHEFTPDEIDYLQLFAMMAIDAIRHAIHYVGTIQSARQLANLHDIARALADEPDDDQLLRSIAGHALNVVTADVVIIYEYSSAKGFFGAPAIAGRCDIVDGGPGDFDGSYSPPLELLQAGMAKFAVSPEALIELYACPEVSTVCEKFVRGAKFVVGGAVPLRLGDEVVGVLFVNYRRPRDFPPYERSVVDLLASVAAVAIQNRRLLREREDCVVAMTHQLRSPLRAMGMKARNARAVLENSRPENGDGVESFALRELMWLVDRLELVDALCDGVYTSLVDKEVQFEADLLDVPKTVESIWNLVDGSSIKHSLVIRVAPEQSNDERLEISRFVFVNVIYSLLHNAKKYADPDSELLVVWCMTPSPTLSVRSYGSPIPGCDRERIFQKFVRANTANHRIDKTDGVGLGLWVARSLMQLIGGNLQLEPISLDPRVSTFLVQFPDQRSRRPKQEFLQ